MQGMMLAKQCHKPCLMPKFTIFIGGIRHSQLGGFLLFLPHYPNPGPTHGNTPSICEPDSSALPHPNSCAACPMINRSKPTWTISCLQAHKTPSCTQNNGTQKTGPWKISDINVNKWPFAGASITVFVACFSAISGDTSTPVQELWAWVKP